MRREFQKCQKHWLPDLFLKKLCSFLAICQLRLDFDSFTTSITNADGTCLDTLAIATGSSKTIPGICGQNTGQHIYLETGRSTSAQTLTFTVAATGSITFKIKIQQIECSSVAKAPNDCFQYFTGVSGRVQTFNFPGQIVPVNLQYSTCIRDYS